jgi:hypothetical protein
MKTATRRHPRERARMLRLRDVSDLLGDPRRDLAPFRPVVPDNALQVGGHLLPERATAALHERVGGLCGVTGLLL